MQRTLFSTVRVKLSPALLLAASIFGSGIRASADDREDLFEKQVRPLLAKHCFECHGESKQQGELRLDRKEAVFQGGMNGPAVIPGKLNESRLWRVVQYDDFDVQMPPKGKLPAADLAILKTWIEQGAYWPDMVPSASSAAADVFPRTADGGIDFAEAARRHWAYRPVQAQAVPSTNAPPEALSTIDLYIGEKLQAQGLGFSPIASRETMIRRLSFDLQGVPPTWEETQAFIADDRHDALSRLVDRMLAGPLYGQRWGRIWLDVARYADTKGYVFTENKFYPYSYTYRDYVIQALNEDKPYDEFVLEQLAADQLGFPDRDPRLAALGFLTVGRRFLNSGPDIIDDRIDVVTRGLLGMTMTCARCHDHKYDPMPTEDYYSLYGVFNSCREPELPPLIGEVDESDPGYQKFQAELKKREQAVADYHSQTHVDLLNKGVAEVDDYLPAAAQLMQLIPKETDLQPKKGAPRSKLVEHWKNFLTAKLKTDHPALSIWKTLMSLPENELAAKGAEALSPLLENPAVPELLKAEFRGSVPASHLDVARRYAAAIKNVTARWEDHRKGTPGAQRLPDDGDEALRSLIYGPGSFTDLVAGDFSPLFERDNRDKIRQLERQVDEWRVTSPDAPPRAMVLLDKDQPSEPVVFIRGNTGRPGPRVPRRTPRILDHDPNAKYQQGSGRLELARDIVDPQNPLTARVIVNRVWAMHFGRGLVVTTSDFGTRSDPPSHPELLDHLAWTFMHEDHWSLKSLHRRILLSHVYLQESLDRPEARKVDPENTLLWRQNRKRLDFESMRDAMLQAAGMLRLDPGGRPFDLESETIVPRRSVYGLIDRNNLPGILRTFDFPSPDASSPGRPLTTIPQQALFAMNSPFSRQVAERLAGSVSSRSGNPEEQTRLLIEQVFSRPARPDEIARVQGYLSGHSLPELCQALLMTNEFLFVD